MRRSVVNGLAVRVVTLAWPVTTSTRIFVRGASAIAAYECRAVIFFSHNVESATASDRVELLESSEKITFIHLRRKQVGE